MMKPAVVKWDYRTIALQMKNPPAETGGSAYRQDAVLLRQQARSASVGCGAM
jgi:hypothetical protein